MFLAVVLLAVAVVVGATCFGIIVWLDRQEPPPPPPPGHDAPGFFDSSFCDADARADDPDGRNAN